MKLFDKKCLIICDSLLHYSNDMFLKTSAIDFYAHFGDLESANDGIDDTLKTVRLSMQ